MSQAVAQRFAGKAEAQPYKSRHPIRIVTAASLFDGHDAAINLMRRILQSTGAEIIHLAHNRSAAEIVTAAIQEDTQAVALTSYQGGHMEFFTYIRELLDKAGSTHVRIFGGGGGTILPEEAQELHRRGITRIYLPDDGRAMGLQGMINDVMEKSDFAPWADLNGALEHLSEVTGPYYAPLARALSRLENDPETIREFLRHYPVERRAIVIGVTGTGGSGKSSLTDEFVQRFLRYFPDKKIAILSIDPSHRKSGGALLGDRLRMNSIYHPHVYMRSFATRTAHRSIPPFLGEAISLLQLAGFDLIWVETAGIGQADTEIVDYTDISVYVMTPEFGAPSQLEKIDMLEYADFVVLNKFDRKGAQDALFAVRKQYQRNFKRFSEPVDVMPVFPTLASQFNDPGVNRFFRALMEKVAEKKPGMWETSHISKDERPIAISAIIPPQRQRYLAEIADTIRSYNQWVEEQAQIAHQLQAIQDTIKLSPSPDIQRLQQELEKQLAPEVRTILEKWEETLARYQAPLYEYTVRDRAIRVQTHTESLSHIQIPKIATPRYRDWGDRVRWALQENFPGHFPYTSGVFPFKRTEEEATRMFAGEGTPERTNRRFHYLASGLSAPRLSTAFDSVTLYGEDPDYRPDIYGKIGNSGVSIATLDDMKKLYSGFDLADPKTSVSMTINGPAPAILAMFMNTAIDQQCEKYIRENGLAEVVEQKIQEKYNALGLPRPVYEGKLPDRHNGLGLMLLGTTGDEVLPQDIYERIKADTLARVRGTVQADILKEDQAQNTCIFAIDFALRMMADVQEYFIQHKVRNFYSVSISGYHIAEAGANPVTQLALTLANGFTYLEYYRSRGMAVDDFAPNFSFFFSNGMDPEYLVIGRVARRIWAKALKILYKASPRSQIFKYHVQTSGRSLHAQEIAFNDIRTTLEALYALADNANSLHTNAYDEAITTPTEESVRRAVAIQLIIQKELGLMKNENPWQGSFFIEWLTDVVEEAVLQEFERLNERGGVLGAMELGYQRNKIQEESLYYETLKHTGQLPIIGVNTFLGKDGSPTNIPNEVVRSTSEEKEQQIRNLKAFQARNAAKTASALRHLQDTALSGKNTFAALMEAVKVASLGQISGALYEVGGKYRRNM
ncbi:MAG: methylmalonyl-CoA mutase family protein [Bacteroidia bacterium]|nr:methylmalonyl-CoA mutase family protein [Bacteroidia bacterium]MCX7652475.1 methylmalonyl-CoA mutase family protein [Bacteroidia bacterium]MDW8416877.1 methylmalonyl-CoA mutase family protein [Bacteroidia bacterium]